MFRPKTSESQNRVKMTSYHIIFNFIYDKNGKTFKSIISWSSDPISIKRPPFESARREKSNDIYYMSVALKLTELFYLEYLNIQLIISRSSD
jgi:hypothetical protein